jgi:hypothetical protein
MTSTSFAQSQDGPYEDQATNLIYQLLFCDRLDLFKENHTGDLQPPWTTLFAEEADSAALMKIAEESHQESRVRMLAFNRLRASGEPVPNRQHLGTIIEVRLPEGLDTMAVFADGGARYINHSGKVVVVEGSPNPFDNEISAVIEKSKPIVAAIGPWDKERLPSPNEGNIRMTFLVSDGLYFGEGPMDAMQQDSFAAPLISAATRLLIKLVDQNSGN